MSKQKRKSKSIEIFAKLTNTGISIPSSWNRNRLMLEAQKVPPGGANIKITINFVSRAKSGEMMGFYWGAVLPMWVAHMKDLITQKDIADDPLIIKKLISAKRIKKSEVDQSHKDFMKYFRPIKTKNWLTGEEEIIGDSLADMDAYNAALVISEIYQHVNENSGMILNTVDFKRARDSMDMIIEQGPRAIAKDTTIEYPKNDITKQIPF